MKFTNVAEAFNFYRNKTIDELEQRAQAINAEIDSNAEADIEALNIELRGIKEARENIELRSGNPGQGVNVITGRNFNGEGGKPSYSTPEDAKASPEYRSAFYKFLMGQKLSKPEQAAFDTVVEKRADAFSASTDVAAAIPTHTLEQVISKARTMGGLMAEARAFSMPSKIAIPIGTPSTKAAWHTEGAAVTTEKVTLSSVTFDGYEIIKIFSISAKARRMTIAAFEAYLVDELTACVMETIGDSLVNGTGSAQGSGLETIEWSATNSVTVGASASATYADVVKVVSLLKRGYSQGAKWAMNNATLYNVFYGMTDSNKRPIFIADPKSESIGKILGFDVVIDDNIADNDAYLGNYSRYLGYNLPEGIAVEVSRESSFKSGLIDYRAMAIADTKPIIEEAFVKLTKAGA